jgi:hypothetical protein
MFPNRVPMDRDTLVTRATVYLFIYVYWSPQKGALLQNVEKHKVTVHRAPRRREAYIQ